jgi:hypothetical protein
MPRGGIGEEVMVVSTNFNVPMLLPVKCYAGGSLPHRRQLRGIQFAPKFDLPGDRARLTVVQ